MIPPRKLLLLSNSTTHGGKYLEWAKNDILNLLRKNNVRRILFVPYASHSLDQYTQLVKDTFQPCGVDVTGVHTQSNPAQAVEQAQCVFIGGGNTFLLLKNLYTHGLIPAIQKRVLQDGVPYIGSSAGTNVATISINTTNDMPIVYPPSFSALKLVPFNINPHYTDPDPNSVHMGATREKRILEYHKVESTPPVLGLREGSALEVNGNKAILKGPLKARIFMRGKEPVEYEPGSDLSFLLSPSQ